MKSKEFYQGLAIIIMANIVACLIITHVPGCNGITERQSYAVSSEVYQATVHTIADLYDAGKIDKDTHAEAVTYARLANAALKAWFDALVNDKPVAESVRAFREAMIQIQVIEEKEVMDNDEHNISIGTN